MSRWTKALLFGAFSAAGVMLLLYFSPWGIVFEERVGLAWLFAVRGPIAPPNDVVVVGLDQRSSSRLDLPTAPYEWPRSLHGKLVDELTRQNVAVIVFDLGFKRPQAIDEDRAFATAVARSGRVVLLEWLDQMEKPAPRVGLPGETSTGTSPGPFDGNRSAGEAWRRRPPLPIFAEAALGLAPFPLPRMPARVTQFWTFWYESAPTLPAVALQARALGSYSAWHRAVKEAGIVDVGTVPQTLRERPQAWNLKALTRSFRTALTSDDGFAPALRRAIADEQRQTPDEHRTPGGANLLDMLVRLYLGSSSHYLNFYGPPGSILTIAYGALLAPDQPERGPGFDLNGASVFVGYSELDFPTKEDSFDTVFTRSDGVQLSGVEIGATAFANLLTGRSLHPAGPLVAGLLMLGFGSVAATCAFMWRPSRAIPAALVLALSYGAAAQLAFGLNDVWLPLATPVLLQLPLVLFVGLLDQYVGARRQRTAILTLMRDYVPQRVAQGLADNPLAPMASGETAYAICLATDAKDYTSMVEGLAAAKAARLLEDYFAALAKPLERYPADFLEFHADNVMFAWLAADVAARQRACLAALDALEAVDVFNTRIAPLHLGTRIGLHAGEIFFGKVGAGGSYAFRLVGDSVNTTSRIDELNKHLGTRLLATEEVVAGVDGLLLRPVGRFRLKGKQAAMTIVEILGTEKGASEAQHILCREFALALAAYQEQRWENAIASLRALLGANPADGPSQFYLEQCLANTSTELSGRRMVIKLDVK